MKKPVLSMILMISLAVGLASCDKAKTNADSEAAESGREETPSTMIREAEGHGQDKDPATAHYQCPMTCEGEKTYSEPGICPECKMKLKEIDLSSSIEEAEGDSTGE